MFTGIIEEVGRIDSLKRNGESLELTIGCGLVTEDVSIGDSISVNGVCLTVSRFDDASFTADAVRETVERSSLKGVAPGDPVNLERALKADGRLGGHFVMGHVDCTGTVTAVRPDRNAVLISVRIPDSFAKYIIEKGSVAVDGISLTIATLAGGEFTVSVIPHTLEQTVLRDARAGRIVNIECDVLGKYIERLFGPQAGGGKITEAWMRKLGY